MPMMHSRKNKRRGFTAVEIAMVASVIAILALLVLPVFRQRSEEARIAAAQDEVSSLTKALLLVEADMPGGGFLPRLNDLDNRSYQEDPASADGSAVNLEPPRARWVAGTGGVPGAFVQVNDADFNIAYSTVIQNWQGPYIAVKNSINLNELEALFPDLTFDDGGGPIQIFNGTGGIDEFSQFDDRYPIDPWGTPYLLFGPDETVYNVRAIYSLGPDGIPGPIPGINTATNHYDRRNGVLGYPGSDDIESIF